ncbi:MAG: HEAT repeat domain-containing protein [Phycisphaerales bacterium]|nr:MAG: HEAT repeat domain-containing protein [Phycisphaerales bacterium]
MDIKRLYLIALILVVVCQRPCPAQNKPPTQGNGAPATEQIDPQLKINRDAVLAGDVDAAGLMLFDDNPKAREILLNVLKQSKNSPARIAVCRALIKARADKKVVKDAHDFIAPLLSVFETQVAEEAKLAAEAALILDYEQIREQLEVFVTDTSTPVWARLNAIHALQLRKDRRATIKLIELLDDQDSSVSSQARIALDSLGISPGDTKEARQATIKQIENQKPEVFLGNRINSLEAKIRNLTAEIDDWRELNLKLLAGTYKILPDDAAKGKFLAEHLASSKAPVKLWALEEAFQWWKGTNPNFPREQLEPILIGSISDLHRDVRLRTAEVLASMVELNSAKPLLTQLELEQDEQVKTQLFVALGWRVNSAISSSEPDKISPEIKQIRTHTLKWAEEFLFDKKSAENAQFGARVVEKLLRRDGLEEAEEQMYLDLLLSRYRQLNGNPEGTLRVELLGAMAGLCMQTSACRDKAIERYKPLFEEALRDGSDSVREMAVDGLANIDKADALAILREGFINDPSLAVRKKIIEMAGAVRVEKDLPWLVEKIGVNSEHDPAWQAMTGIFNRSGADTLNKWVDRLTAETSKVKLTNEQRIAFLKTAESKAESEKKTQMLKQVRERLAVVHLRMSQFDKAAECWQKLQAAAKTQEEKEAAVVRQLDIYLTWPRPDLAANLLDEVLKKQDLDQTGALLKSLDEHLANPKNGLDPNALVALLEAIEPPKERPKWNQWLAERRSRLSKEDETAEKPKPPTE